MAEKKNFTIENYNGTDYDTLYPETNSGQVLLDAQAQETLNLESGKTLDDAFESLAVVKNFDSRYEVGDVVTTARKNLGDKWALCNGAASSTNEYPELGQYFKSDYLNYEKIYSDSIGGYDDYYMVARERDGIKEALVYCSKSNSSKQLYINFSNGSSSTNTHASTRMNIANNIFFNENTYCDGNPQDESSWHTLSGVGRYAISDVLYKNGKYYVLASNSLYIYTSLSSTPQIVDINSLTHRTVINRCHIGTDGDNIIIITTDSTTSIESICYAETIAPNGNLSSTQMIRRINNSTYGCLLTKFGNVYLLINKQSIGKAEYYYSNTISGSFTKIIDSNTEYDLYINNVVDDLYAILPNNSYLSSYSLTTNSSAGTTDGTTVYISISNQNVYLLSTSGINTANVYCSPKYASFSLPLYSPASGLYAYIKAKS